MCTNDSSNINTYNVRTGNFKAFRIEKYDLWFDPFTFVF